MKIIRAVSGIGLCCVCLSGMALVADAQDRVLMQSCTGALIDHTINYYSKIIAGATQNVPVDSVTFTTATAAPFKKDSAVTCERVAIDDATYQYRCSGTFGQPCGFVSNRHFFCDFLNPSASNASLGYFAAGSPGATTSNALPDTIHCQVCIPWQAGTPQSTKDEAAKIFQHHEQNVSVVTVDDASAAVCS